MLLVAPVTVEADSVPLLIVVVPVYVFDPDNVSVPAPVFVRPPAPLITPATETGLPLESIVPVAESVTERVDGDVIVPAACSVPPLKISVFVALPSPIAPLEFAFSVP